MSSLSVLPPNSSPSAPHSLPSRVLNHIRSLTPLLLTIAARLVILTCMISILGMEYASEVSRRFYGGLKPQDIILITWIFLSSALYVPGSLLIEVGYLAYLGWDFCFVSPWSWWKPEDSEITVLYSVTCMDFFFKWLLVLTIVALRLLSFAFAVRDAYQANRQSRHHSRMLYQTPKTSVWLLIAKIILGNDYDWWTVKPRPVEITTIPWYRRMIRPFFDQPNQDGTTDSVKTFPAIIFGEHTFRARRGDGKWFTIIRGSIAVGLVIGIVCYGLDMLVIEPTQEQRASPVQLQRLIDLPEHKQMSTPTWGVVLAVDPRYIPQGTTIQDAFSVHAELSHRDIALPPCTMKEYTFDDVAITKWGSEQFFAYQCLSTYIDIATVYQPQIIIRVNYTMLGINNLNYSPESSVKVWTSMSDKLDAVLSTTQPTSLMYGARTIAGVYRSLRSTFSNPTAATFGFDANPFMHTVGRLSQYPLPATNAASLHPILAVMGPDTLSSVSDLPTEMATMRLFREYMTMDWEMQADIRRRSVLNGVSSLGGFAISLDAVFLIVFGGSLLLVVFDSKPLSIFGLLHSIFGQRLTKGYAEDFPLIKTEGGLPGDQEAGVISFMREYMLDFVPISSKKNVDSGRKQKQTIRSDSSESEITIVGQDEEESSDWKKDIHEPPESYDLPIIDPNSLQTPSSLRIRTSPLIFLERVCPSALRNLPKPFYR